MTISFDDIKESLLANFKGGDGDMIARMYVDKDNKIMLSRLKPGASIGYHKHADNSEIVYVLSGTGVARCDEAKEQLHAGAVHYCPRGHSHSIANTGEADLVLFAVVPEHKQND